MYLKIREKLGLGFGVLALLFALLGGFFCYTLDKVHDDFTATVAYDVKSIAGATEMLQVIVDMEAGQRGFVITGQEAFLEPYKNGRARFAQLIRIERDVHRNQPDDLKMLDLIEANVQRWHQLAAEPEIAMRRKISDDFADNSILQDTLSKGVGKSILDQIRKIINQMRIAFQLDGNVKGELLTCAIEAAMVNQETGQRGFLITGKEEFLEPYVAGIADLKIAVTGLQSLIANTQDRQTTARDLDEFQQFWKGGFQEKTKQVFAKRQGETEELIGNLKAIMQRIAERFEKAENVRACLYVARIAESINEQENGLHGFLLTGKEKYRKQFYRAGQTCEATLKALRDLNANAYDADVMNENISKLWHLANMWLKDAARPEIALRWELNKHPENLADVAKMLENGVGKTILDTLRVECRELLKKQKADMKTRHANADQKITQMTSMTVVSVVVSIGLILIVGVVVTRQVTRPVRRLSNAVGRVAEGDLSEQIVTQGQDELADLATAFNQMVDNLNVAEKDRRYAEQVQSDYADALESTNVALAEASEAADNANAAKSEFLANMSHEIRTPMTAILGFTEVVLEHAENQGDIESLETIQRNGEHLLTVINDILDFSKIDSGKLDIECIRCSLPEIFGDVQAMMKARVDAKGLKQSVTLEGPVPRYIQTDPTRLRQILLNIVDNAIKFTETGSIRLMVRLIDAESECPAIHIDIIDTGIGMSEQQMSRLFQPFNQADSSITRKFGGTGLGLTISQRLADQLGGTVTVDSSPGKGSTFTVTIATGPLDRDDFIESFDLSTQAVSEDDPRDSTASLQGYRILLAEDGPDNQRLISFLLKKAGAEVVLAENGEIALNEAISARNRHDPFDLILMDIQMPVLDGFNATRKLRESEYQGPIIALTAHAMIGYRDKTTEAGCDGYVSKPINRDQLIQTIVKHVERNRSLETALSQ